MQSTVIRHPENARYIIRYEWAMRMLDFGREINPNRVDTLSECGAELLSVFEYHTHNKWANRLLVKTIDSGIQKKRQRYVHEVGHWLPYSYEYMRELLFYSHSQTTMTAVINLLTTRSVIETNVPEDIKSNFGHNGIWVLLRTDKINHWLDTHWPKSWIEGHAEKIQEQELSLSAAEPLVQKEDNSEAVQLMRAIFAFYKHIHGKTEQFLLDGPRRANVRNIVKACIRSKMTPELIMGYAAQVIIGYTFSKFHMGDNDGKKLFDDIELFFRSVSHCDRGVGYAEAHNVTQDLAFRHLQAFLSDVPSSYAKRMRKPSQKTAIGSANGAGPNLLASPDEQKRYREFGQAIGMFFGQGVRNSDIIQMIKENESLAAAAKGLIVESLMVEALFKSARLFHKQGIPGQIDQQIRTFAASFCKLQKIQSV